jgi:hypothetical protein
MNIKFSMYIGFGLLLGIASAARIEPDLLRRLEAADSPNQKFAVSFVLKDQARAIDLDPNTPNLPKPERRASVGRVLMDFAEASQQDLLSYLRTREAEGKVEDISPLWIVNSVGCWATRDVIDKVAQRSDVALIYYDRVPCELGHLELKEAPPATDEIPPNLIAVNVRGAWSQGYHGEGIVLGVVDTGVRYTHMDLRNHLWMSDAYPNHGFNFASNQYTAHRNRPGPSPYDTLTPLDYYGHGTHVAGIATADGAYGQGIHETLGVAPATKVMCIPVDVYAYSPYPDTSLENSEMEGFQFCVRPYRDTLNGADVITTSLGFTSSWLPRYAVWRIAEEHVRAAGLVHLVAAGERTTGGGRVRCPGCCPPPWRNPENHPIGSGHERDTATTAVVSVGTADDTIMIWPDPIGPSVMWDSIPPWFDYEYPPGLVDPDVVMPGLNVVSTYSSSDNAYTTMSGSSMATPAAAGAICLMLSKNAALSPLALDSIVELYGVHHLGPPDKNNYYGAGVIDCSLAVAYTPPPVVAVGEQPIAKASSVKSLPTIVRGVIQVDSRQHTAYSAELLDISGRKVLDLTPGPNDVSRLAPGVYFVREDSGLRSAVCKVVLTR